MKPLLELIKESRYSALQIGTVSSILIIGGLFGLGMILKQFEEKMSYEQYQFAVEGLLILFIFAIISLAKMFLPIYIDNQLEKKKKK